MSFKCERIGEDIRRQVSLLIRNLKNVSLASKGVSVMHVSMNKDCSLAKIYISSIKGDIYAKQAVKLLERASGYLKHEISKNLRLKKVPNVKFVVDDSLRYSEHIEDLFSKISR